MRNKNLTLALAATAALMLAGCGKDRGECLASHVEHPEGWMMPITTWVSTGNGAMTPITTLQYIPPSDDTVCDKWQFPKGRPE